VTSSQILRNAAVKRRGYTLGCVFGVNGYVSAVARPWCAARTAEKVCYRGLLLGDQWRVCSERNGCRDLDRDVIGCSARDPCDERHLR